MLGKTVSSSKALVMVRGVTFLQLAFIASTLIQRLSLNGTDLSATFLLPAFILLFFMQCSTAVFGQLLSLFFIWVNLWLLLWRLLSFLRISLTGALAQLYPKFMAAAFHLSLIWDAFSNGVTLRAAHRLGLRNRLHCSKSLILSTKKKDL